MHNFILTARRSHQEIFGLYCKLTITYNNLLFIVMYHMKF